MKIALFGATGQTGRHFVSLAQGAGHTIQALVRDPSKLGDRKGAVSAIEVFAGDVTDRQKVSETVAGAQAVVNLLGHATGSPRDIMVQSTKHIIDAANEHAAQLLITMSTAGVKIPADGGSMGQTLMRLYLKTVEPAQMTDHQAMCDMLRQTKEVGFEWVVVRAARLTEHPSARNCREAGQRIYRVDIQGVPGLNPHVARAEVARCIVDLLANGEHRGEMPFVF